MELSKEECVNAALVLQKTIKALKEKDALVLKDLSNQTIHSSCTFQDSGTITSAVLIYTLSKLIERSDYKKIPSWDKFEKKISSFLKLAISALKQNNHDAYERHMIKARQTLESVSRNLKPYIEEVLRKASINKASKIHEHGISSEKTARMLGLTQWEISEYLGSKPVQERLTEKLTIQKRIALAQSFFS